MPTTTLKTVKVSQTKKYNKLKEAYDYQKYKRTQQHYYKVGKLLIETRGRVFAYAGTQRNSGWVELYKSWGLNPSFVNRCINAATPGGC